MKIGKILLISIFSAAFCSVFAQKGVEDGSMYGHGEDSIRCIQSLSIYRPYMKQKDYASALPYWETAYKECPSSRIFLYLDGVKIRKWQIKNEKDTVKKKEYFGQLMQVYDQRIKYFGNSRRYPKKPWILGRKAVDYIVYGPGDLEIPYGWLDTCMNAFAGDIEPAFAEAYMDVAIKKLRNNSLSKELFIEDYLKAVKNLDLTSVQPKYKKRPDYIEKYKESVNKIFANSGVANAGMLDSLFSAKVDSSKDNIAYLQGVVNVYKSAGLVETPVYFRASEYIYNINPTSEAAEGMAYQAIKKEDFETAAKYFDEAVKMVPETDKAKKAEYEYLAASAMYASKRYAAARTHAYKALEYDPQHGESYVLIAKMYAASTGIYKDDPVLRRTVYWAAVDKLYKAKSIKPELAKTADSLAVLYAKQFPTKEDIFMHPALSLEGNYKVGGWINENTRCRSRK